MVDGWTRRYAESSLTVITRGKLYLGSATIISPLWVPTRAASPNQHGLTRFFTSSRPTANVRAS